MDFSCQSISPFYNWRCAENNTRSKIVFLANAFKISFITNIDTSFIIFSHKLWNFFNSDKRFLIMNKIILLTEFLPISLIVTNSKLFASVDISRCLQHCCDKYNEVSSIKNNYWRIYRYLLIITNTAIVYYWFICGLNVIFICQFVPK